MKAFLTFKIRHIWLHFFLDEKNTTKACLQIYPSTSSTHISQYMRYILHSVFYKTNEKNLQRGAKRGMLVSLLCNHFISHEAEYVCRFVNHLLYLILSVWVLCCCILRSETFYSCCWLQSFKKIIEVLLTS